MQDTIALRRSAMADTAETVGLDLAEEAEQIREEERP